MPTRRSVAVGALMALATAFTSPSLAQPTSDSPLAPPANGPKHADPSWHAIVGATVHTRPGQTLERATVVFRDGVIVSVGAGAPPDGARIWDATGLHVYAAFIDAFVEVDTPTPDAASPGLHWNSRVTPQRSVLSGPGLSEDAKKDLRAMGFATAAVAPKGGVFRGLSALVSLDTDHSDRSLGEAHIYDTDAYHTLAFDKSGWSSGEYPTSHMGVMALYRQTLLDADWQEGADKNAINALTPLYTADAPLCFVTTHELETLLARRIQNELNTGHILLVGSGSEFRRLDAISTLDASLIVPLRFPSKPDVSSIGKADATSLDRLMAWEQAPTNARRLHDAGLRVALTSSNLPKGQKFRTNLRSAIEHGLSEDDALAMLTTAPASILGMDTTLGAVAPGFAASLIIADGPIFDKDTKILDVWTHGARHMVNPPKGDDLAGDWNVTIDNALSARLEIDDDNAITLYVSDAAGKESAHKGANASIDDSAISFSVIVPALAGDSPIIFSAVHTRGELMGAMMRPRGAPAQWRAVRARPGQPDPEPSAFEGDWTLTMGESQTTIKLSVEGETITGFFEDKTIEARDIAFDGDRVSFTMDDPFGDDRVFTITCVLIDGEIVGKVLSPDDDSYAMTGARTQDEPKHADIPEILGAPFGSYTMPALPERPDYVVISGATVWTCGPDGILRPEDTDTLVVLKDGLIDYVGPEKSLRFPADATNVVRIDAEGKHVTPGLIDAHSHTGLFRFGVNESGQAVTSECWIGDSLDPGYINWYRQLAGGVTTANLLHGSANPIGGQSQIVKVRWGAQDAEAMFMDGAKPGIKFALGENVKQSNWGDNKTTRYPQTRMGVETIIRDRFQAAKEYAERHQRARQALQDMDHLLDSNLVPDERRQAVLELAKEFFSEGGDGGARAPDGRTKYQPFTPSEGALAYKELSQRLFPRRNLELEALAQILAGDRLVHCHSYRQDEILMLCRIAEDFGFKIGSFQHGLETYKVAETVREHALGASIFSDWWAYKLEVQDAIPYAGPINHEAGLLTSFNSDSDELARRMNLEAAKAVKYSSGRVSPEEALKFVTINPAIMLGVNDRIGSLEAGKDADVVIWSGDPLSSFSRPESVWIDGREYFSLERDKAHRSRIAGERERLIKKILAIPADDKSKDADNKDEGEVDIYMVDSPPFAFDDLTTDPYMRPGDCGCSASNHNLQFNDR